MKHLISAVAIVVLAPFPALSQEGGVLVGRVLNRATGQPVSAAQLVPADGRAVAVDSLGRFRVTHLALGPSQLVVRAIGFTSQTLSLHFDRAGEQVFNVSLDSAGRDPQTLPSFGVSAAATTATYRLTAFERRRRTGRGQYMTEQQIVSSGAFNVPDLVKHMRGVIYECAGNGCTVRISRAPSRCLPEYIVDEQVMNDFGMLTPIRDIIALEVYTGPADVPGEYAGRNAGCGVIVIHTRTGPRPG
jgi:hypothetical protein